MRFSALLAIALFCALPACKDLASPKAQAQLATDLPSETTDQILKSVARRGGPPAERIAGLGLGAAALPAAALPQGPADGESSPTARAAAAQAMDSGEPAEPLPARPGVIEPPASAVVLDGGGAQAAAASASVHGDVRWDLEPYGAIAAAGRGELQPMPAAGADVPDLWRDPGGTWVAVGGRARVLLVNNKLRGERQGPFRLATLVDPLWKGQVAVAAPVGGAALAHFAALYIAWGEIRMRGWLKGLQDNGAQRFATDAEVRLAVVQGRAAVGLVGSDEAAKAAAIADVTVVYPDQRTIGTFIWPTALSRPRNAPHAEQGALLAEQLADKATEQQLVAREPGFIPLRPGIPVPVGVRSAWNLRVVAVEPQQIVAAIESRRAELAAWAAQH